MECQSLPSLGEVARRRRDGEVFVHCIPPSHPAYTLIRARTGKEHHHGAESVPGRSACGGCGLHRQGGAAPRDRTTDLGLSAAGAAHRQVLRKAGGAAKTAGPRAADAGRIFALYRVLSGRRGGGAVPDRAEAAPSPRPSSCPLSRPRRGQPASRARPNTSTAGPSTPAASRCGGPTGWW